MSESNQNTLVWNFSNGVIFQYFGLGRHADIVVCSGGLSCTADCLVSIEPCDLEVFEEREFFFSLEVSHSGASVSSLKIDCDIEEYKSFAKTLFMMGIYKASSLEGEG